MAYNSAEGRRQLLDDFAAAIDALGVALAALGAAYEVLDERTADRMEEELFRPVQAAGGRAGGAAAARPAPVRAAAGRARRAHAAFASRYGLSAGTFADASAGPPSLGARGFLDRAVEAV